MNQIWYLILMTALISQTPSAEAPSQPNLIAALERDTSMSAALGLSKLSETEKATWNIVLNHYFQEGVKAGRQQSLLRPSGATGFLPGAGTGSATGYTTGSGYAYKSKIETDDNGVLVLANGAVVEVTVGYVGYVGYRKDCVLFRDGSQWMIWIEGKRAFKCDVLKPPSYGARIPSRVVYMIDVKGEGSILEMDDGSLYEVDVLGRLHTSLWLGMVEVLILNESELIKLDDGDEIVNITRIR